MKQKVIVSNRIYQVLFVNPQIPQALLEEISVAIFGDEEIFVPFEEELISTSLWGGPQPLFVFHSEVADFSRKALKSALGSVFYCQGMIEEAKAKLLQSRQELDDLTEKLKKLGIYPSKEEVIEMKKRKEETKRRFLK